MAEVGFYHLTRTGLDAALPRLLGRTLGAGQRALVLCGSEERVAALDTALWLCADPDWLPHGTRGSDNADLQPIWLAAAEGFTPPAPNGARYLFLIDGVALPPGETFERVFDLFDGGGPAAVDAARTRWTAAKAAGHRLAYWQQGPHGWERRR